MMSNTETYTYLNFIDFQLFSTWDVKKYLSASIKSNFSIEKLGKHIKEENNRVFPKKHPEKDYEILGVNNKTGIFDAYIQKGKEIKQPYKILDNGFLAYNPYRINVGSIGLKMPIHKYKYISPAYVVFSCKKDLSPEFLFLMFKTERFNQIIKDSTTGSVRQNLSFTNLSNIEIPLPTLKEQERLIKDYQNKIQLAKKLENEAINLEEDIEKYLLEELELTFRTVQKVETGKLYFVDFLNLQNWVYSSDEITFYEDLHKSKYKVDEIGNIFSFITRTWNKKKEENKEYIEIGAIDPNFGILETKTINSKKAPSRATQLVKKGDLIIGTTRPYLKKFTIIDEIHDGFVASSGFSVVEENKEKYNLYYLNEVLKSNIGIKQFEIKMTGALYPAITQSDLSSLKIPVPSLEIQNKIASNIEQMKQNQKNKTQQAEILRKEAIKDFENIIFI